jgi:peptidoglycan hydrolase-like protein with peptidoglycan-binding domain
MEALRLFLAAVLLPAQFLVAGPAAANDSLVFRAQQKLTNLGYPAQPDGIHGRATRRAIMEFQQDRGLRVGLWRKLGDDGLRRAAYRGG